MGITMVKIRSYDRLIMCIHGICQHNKLMRISSAVNISPLKSQSRDLDVKWTLLQVLNKSNCRPVEIKWDYFTSIYVMKMFPYLTQHGNAILQIPTKLLYLFDEATKYFNKLKLSLFKYWLQKGVANLLQWWQLNIIYTYTLWEILRAFWMMSIFRRWQDINDTCKVMTTKVTTLCCCWWWSDDDDVDGNYGDNHHIYHHCTCHHRLHPIVLKW